MTSTNNVSHTVSLRITSVVLESEIEEAIERAVPHIRSYFLNQVLLINLKSEDREEMSRALDTLERTPDGRNFTINWPSSLMADKIRQYFLFHQLSMCEVEFIVNGRYVQLTLAPVKEADVINANQYDFKGVADKVKLRFEKVHTFQL